MEFLEKGKGKGQEKEEEGAFAFCPNNECPVLVIHNT